MTNPQAAADLTTSQRAFTLWIDGCGGFRLLTGSQWNVGGASSDAGCLVAVQTDWPRRAGQIERIDGEYFWNDDRSARQWLRQDSEIPIPGVAKLMFHRPSPLSQSVTLRLNSAHRFAGHVDAIVLVQDTVLAGPGLDCHLRCRGLDQRLVLMEKNGEWRIKMGQNSPQQLACGRRFVVDKIGMTLELG